MVAACIPNPSGDYKDFKERTANLVPQPVEAGPSDAAPFDSKPPDTAVEALYVGICVTSLAAGDPEQALRFYTKTKYTPDAANPSQGTLSMSVAAMVGWDVALKRPISPKIVAASEVRGNAIEVAPMTVTGTGRLTAQLGTVNHPEEANSISGRTAVIEGAALDGLFGAGDRFCTTLGGQLTIPYSFTFEPSANTCLFQKVKEGDPLPQIPAADYV
jgi:hypothetical protein